MEENGPPPITCPNHSRDLCQCQYKRHRSELRAPPGYDLCNGIFLPNLWRSYFLYRPMEWGQLGASFLGHLDPGHSLRSIGNRLFIARYEESIDSNWVYYYEDGQLSKWGEGVFLSTASGFSELPNIYDIIEYNGTLIACGEFDRWWAIRKLKGSCNGTEISISRAG
jgi:hypothetical protein